MLGVEGREVITTPFTFVATAEAIIRAGAIPVFADIDPATFTIDPDEVARKVTAETACIVPVDIAGGLAEYTRLAKVTEHFKLPMIADASHSLGATLQRRTSAQWTDAAAHSFQATKNLTTAEGGCVGDTAQGAPPAGEAVVAARVDIKRIPATQSPASGEYDVVGIGMKGNLTDVHGGDRVGGNCRGLMRRRRSGRKSRHTIRSGWGDWRSISKRRAC